MLNQHYVTVLFRLILHAHYYYSLKATRYLNSVIIFLFYIRVLMPYLSHMFAARDMVPKLQYLAGLEDIWC